MTRAASAIAALTVAACSVGDLDLAGKACPCIAGYSCDPTTHTCVPRSPVDDGGLIGDGAAADQVWRGADGPGSDVEAAIPCGNGGIQCGTACVDPTSSTQNCGSCGHDCTPGLCAFGKCQQGTLYTNVGFIGAMTFDAANIYWVTGPGIMNDPTTTRFAPKGGGNVTTLVTTMGLSPLAAVLDATTLYWSTTTTAMGAPTSYWSCPIAGCGGTASMLATTASTSSIFPELLLAGSYLYNPIYLSAGSIQQIPTAGGAPNAFYSGSYPESIASDGTYLYWIDQGATLLEIRRCLLPSCAGGAATVYAPPASMGNLDSTLVVDAASVYFTITSTTLSTTVYKCASSACTSPTVLVANSSYLGAPFIRNGYLYWLSLGSVFERVPVGGGAPEVLLRDLCTGSESVCPGFFGVDATAAYWYVQFTTSDIRKQVF